jgi:group I intron endonuclease
MSDSKEVRLHCIYKLTSPSGKSYIGQTNNYHSRMIGHKNSFKKAKNSKRKLTRIENAIKKYGFENFKKEILITNITRSKIDEYEKFYISEHKTLSPNGYNLRIGGDLSTFSEDVKAQMSESAKIRYNSLSDEDKLEWNKSLMENTRRSALANKIAKWDKEGILYGDKLFKECLNNYVKPVFKGDIIFLGKYNFKITSGKESVYLNSSSELRRFFNLKAADIKDIVRLGQYKTIKIEVGFNNSEYTPCADPDVPSDFDGIVVYDTKSKTICDTIKEAAKFLDTDYNNLRYALIEASIGRGFLVVDGFYVKQYWRYEDDLIKWKAKAKKKPDRELLNRRSRELYHLNKLKSVGEHQ